MLGRKCQSGSDCVRACVATLIDQDDVPHLFDGRAGEESWQAMREYLATKGKKLAMFAVDDLETMAIDNPDIPYMLLCGVGENENHAIVGMNGKVLFDPAWICRKLEKHTMYNCWIVCLII